MIVIQEDGNYFGETKVLGIGNAKPELKYGKMAKKLREDAKLTLEELSKEFSVKIKQLEDIEEQKKGMTEELMSKYMEKFNVEKEYFFDTAYHIKYEKKIEHTTKLYSVYSVATS